MSSRRQLRIRPRGWLVIIPVAGLLFFAYRWMGVLSIDNLFSINAGCQFLLIILGVIVAVKPTAAVEHPWRVIAAFVLLGAIGMFAAVRQQQQSARESAEAQRQLTESNTKLSASLDRLGGQADEITRVQRLNTELQERLLSTTEQTSNQITGADSYCVFLADFSAPTSQTSASVSDPATYTSYSVDAVVYGKYPMNDVTTEFRSKNSPVFMPDTPYSFSTGTALLSGKTREVGQLTTGTYHIIVSSRNGKLTQQLEIGLTNGKPWQRAKVWRDGKALFSFDSRNQ